mmetsp:Transcript_12848/g.30363  ORF Transcript_12848/g.30363 Transcript_12848/m.30363 type:complete len:221 (-) Transcript_12848:235-897(-)
MLVSPTFPRHVIELIDSGVMEWKCTLAADSAFLPKEPSLLPPLASTRTSQLPLTPPRSTSGCSPQVLGIETLASTDKCPCKDLTRTNLSFKAGPLTVNLAALSAILAPLETYSEPISIAAPPSSASSFPFVDTDLVRAEIRTLDPFIICARSRVGVETSTARASMAFLTNIIPVEADVQPSVLKETLWPLNLDTDMLPSDVERFASPSNLEVMSMSPLSR